MRRQLILLMGVVIIVLAAGGSYIYLASQSGGTYFVVDVLGERFTMLVVDKQAVKDALDNMNGLNSMYPIGVLDFGNGGFNQPWGWHYKPETVAMTEISTEVCDAEPHFVQENLDYWVNTVKYYCPWAAKIISASTSIPSYVTSSNLEVNQIYADLAAPKPSSAMSNEIQKYRSGGGTIETLDFQRIAVNY